MLSRFAKFLTIGLLLCLWWGRMVIAKPNPSKLVQQGVELYHQGQITAAIENWQLALSNYIDEPQLEHKTIILENLARAYQNLGQSDRSLDYWQQASDNYRRLGNNRQLERSLTEQAQIYARLGEHQQAIALLCGTDSKECLSDSAINLAQQNQDRLGEAAAWGSLGETYRLRGNYQQAVDYLQTSLAIANKIDNSRLEIAALNSLGNTHSSIAQVNYRRAVSAQVRGEDFGSNNNVVRLNREGKNSDRQATKYLAESRELAKKQENREAQLKAIISSLPIYYRQKNNTAAAKQVQQALSLLPTISTTPDKVYATINLAQHLQPEAITPNTCYRLDTQATARELLEQAVETAESLQDPRSQSFAVGELGHFYECRGDYQQALKLSQSARLLAEQKLSSPDSLYLWEWQTARIYQQQGNTSEAIAAYQQAIATLNGIRNNILTANRDIQFNFRDTVEPVYRELITLQLENIAPGTLVAATTYDFDSVLTVFDSLQLAELQNYFGNECAIEEASSNQDIEQDNDSAVIFHSIMLPQRTAIIASFPDGDRQLAWIAQDSSTLKSEIIAFNEGLVRWYDTKYDKTLSQTLYQQMIKPFAQSLRQRQIETLVFVQDGLLRNLPMSALHDGQQYLIEKYAIASTPSLTITETESLKRQNLNVLALGLTTSSSINGNIYPPLPQVRREIQEIEQKFKNTKPLLNQKFTRDRLEAELASATYSIVHIASHGRFGTEPQDTFLITGKNQTLSITELDRILRNAPQGTEPIELLSLTACETALGDARATLGLAGVAVQAGAKSAIASLWSLDDNVTPQITDRFYTSLQNPSINKAQALQQAQLELIKQDLHPAYWASFILIGNWL